MSEFRRFLLIACSIIVTFTLAVLCVRFYLQKRSAERNVAALSKLVSNSQKTTEVHDGVFQRDATDIDDLTEALAAQQDVAEDLQRTLSEERAKIVAYSQLAISWKKKYEGLAHATQTTQLPNEPGLPERVRIDFDKEFGPLRVSGHTVTSPPEAFVAVEQTRPIRLGISLAQKPDGTWTSIVDTEDNDSYNVQIQMTAVERGLKVSSWRDRLSFGLDVGMYEVPSLGISAVYGSNVAVGPRCSVYASSGTDWSCGVSIYWRPFTK